MGSDEWWVWGGVAASAANVAAMLGLWAMGRENLRLRRKLDAVEADRDRLLESRRELIRAVSDTAADASRYRSRYAAAAHANIRLRQIVQRLWKDRRVRQYNDGAARTEGYLIGVGDAARVMERNADDRLADTRSLAMCDELARYDIGGEAGV